MYFTGSREVAAGIRSEHPQVMASTGGPNTLVATELTPAVSEAIRLSATIENSGQCTALRHAVVPGAGEADLEQLFEGTFSSRGAAHSLQEGEFAGIFDFAGNVFDHDAAGRYTLA